MLFHGHIILTDNQDKVYFCSCSSQKHEALHVSRGSIAHRDETVSMVTSWLNGSIFTVNGSILKVRQAIFRNSVLHIGFLVCGLPTYNTGNVLGSPYVLGGARAVVQLQFECF